MGELVRLQRYLASAGVAARRKAEELITAGRVTVNGVVVTELGTKVDPDTAEVTVDGEGVMAHDKFYVLLNKPKACITAVTDDRGRPTVMDYLPNVPVPVKPVGRLDFYSEGVLLLTNDGEMAAKLLAPASHVAKTYHVKVHGQLSNDEVKRLREGITLDDGTETMPAEIEVLPGESKHTWLAITIHEGKHRQIHRMIEALGYAVDKLQRVAFANLTFHNLRVGDARELSQMELNQLRDLVGLDHSPVARGRWRSDREDTDIPRRARAKAREEAEAEAAENEENRLRNEAARAAAGGDAWDGEGDADRDPEGADERFISADDDDQRGAPLPHVEAPAPKPRGKGKPYESRAVGRRDPDDPRAPRGGFRSDARGDDSRGAGRGGSSSDAGAGSRGAAAGDRAGSGGASRGGFGSESRGGDSRGADRGGFRSDAGSGERADSRGAGRGGFRSDAGPGVSGAGRGGFRSDAGPGSRGAGAGDRGGDSRGGDSRGEGRGGARALPPGQREVRQYAARPGLRRDDAPRSSPSGDDAGRGARTDSPGARSDGPRGARTDGPRGARTDGPRTYSSRSDGPRGARADGPRGARADGPRSYSSRSDGPRGARADGPRGARADGPRAPRADGPRGGGRAFGSRSDSAPRGDGPRGARADGPRGGGRTFGARSDSAPHGDGPRGARADGPRGARADGPRGARGDGPRGARSDGPRGGGRTFGSRSDSAPRGARGDGPRGAEPARDKGRWRDRESGPRSRDEAAFGTQEPDQKPRGRGARAPGPGGARGQGRSFGKKSDKRR